MSPSLESATRTLLDNFNQVDNASPLHVFERGGGISSLDLAAIAQSKDPSISPQLRKAARLVLDSQTVERFLDVRAGRGELDHFISRADLKDAAATLQEGSALPELLDTADGGKGGRDGIVGDNDYRAALSDPGLPDKVRDAILRDLGNERLLQIFGQPNVQGTSAEQHDLRKSVADLIRLSPTHAREAKALIEQHVPMSIDTGAEDKGYSYWDPGDLSLHISRSMVDSGDRKYLTEVLAHEGGHAIFHYSGLEAKIQALVKDGKLPDGMDGIINEAFAGSFGNRAKLEQSGSADNLSLLDDVGKNIASDDTFYAQHYGVDTADARAHLPQIEAALQSLVPYLQDQFGMHDDLLTKGL